MSKEIQIIIDSTQTMRERMLRVWDLVMKAIEGGPVVVTLGRINKSREQEKRYHALIRDIHRCAFRGNTFEGVKALMVAEFANEMQENGTPLTHPGESVYSHKLKEWITVRPSTRKFKKQEANDFIEFLHMLGSDLGVKWSTSADEAYLCSRAA